MLLRSWSGLWIVLFVLVLGTPVEGQGWSENRNRPTQNRQLARVDVFADAVAWEPDYAYKTVSLRVSGPDGFYYEKAFNGEDPVCFDVTKSLIDGSYSYELVVTPILKEEIREELNKTRGALESDALLGSLREEGEIPPQVQSGYFTIKNGVVSDPELSEPLLTGGVYAYSRTSPGTGSPDPTPKFDQVILDDLIVDGSACIGIDCVNGESFGFDTIRLKENNLRIKFQDTSSTSSFPSNDWQLTANDSANGGANKFSIDDIDGGRTPFTIEAGAPSHSLYVEDGGRVGFGTSVPVVDLHVVKGNTPTLRLEQNGSSGFTPQTWDVAGNEANFFIRDASNGSTLPFRIFPGADSNSMTIAASSDVGIGHTNPDASLHIRRTDETAKLAVEEASGTTAVRTLFQLINNGGSRFSLVDTNSNKEWFFSMDGNSDFGISLVGTGGSELLVKKDGAIQMGPGATTVFNLSPTGNLEIGGALTEFSDRNAKKNIQTVDGQQVLEKLVQLPLSEWTYKTDEDGVRHLGPMAQDFQATFGLGQDERHLATMDTSGVALAAIQGLHEKLQEKDARIRRLEAELKQVESLKAELAEIKRMLGTR